MSETESLMLRILERIQADVAEVKTELAELRHDMETGFRAVLQQGDRRFLNHEGRIRHLEQEVRMGFRAMRTGFTTVGGRLDTVEERLTGIEERLPPKR